MSTWRDDPNAIPPWNERPKCHCGFRTWLQVWTDPLPQGKQGCRFLKCPNIDDDFKACTFMQWIDTRPLGRVRFHQVETKGQYHARHTQAREEARLAREEQERRVRQQQREAALKIQEEQFQAREAQLKREEDELKNRYKEPAQSSTSDGRNKKGKFLRFTQ
ncbi:hypothetical protein HU200_062995 [Digitaria exilis]|uniref:Zinc finger GRF-type domain-containing protein n=1 Tax=Digitaria exilis TaxID=1010633 RepID=A0A835DXQ6_9POAL|nr:hypothetical protein HU200_062995 [Digitaria exilis]